ncbi:MAG TPA: bifunctional DNA-formamidopyrimidine glycosylase/DNA-(apurinic or apyrimidinic site) lyase [Dehalococcoidia bacterium]|nr:bifunctional DNA-formamidopyrimidine glycosylase/DNA-(apurinic or apyrimidinic site) lyase [Dehalococcoidia bacterium]
MPELPEVETLRRLLGDHLAGRVIDRVEVRLPKIIRPPGGLPPEAVIGHRILGLRRRAKILIWELSDGLAVIFHLKLSGQLHFVDAAGDRSATGGHPVPPFGAPLPHKATHVIFHFADGSRLFFTDIRQFGYVRFLTAEGVADHLAAQAYGPEPLDPDFTWPVFERLMARRPKMYLKPLLLDQSFIAGLGNIYADESLHLARLHPLRRAGDLTRLERRRLYEAIRAVLDRAVTEGIADFSDGAALDARGFPASHGREGRPCHTCAEPIRRIRVGTRSTYFCPTCQQEERGAKISRSQSNVAAISSRRVRRESDPVGNSVAPKAAEEVASYGRESRRGTGRAPGDTLREAQPSE